MTSRVENKNRRPDRQAAEVRIIAARLLNVVPAKGRDSVVPAKAGTQCLFDVTKDARPPPTRGRPNLPRILRMRAP